MKKIIMMFAALAMTMGANAQGNNIGMGGGDGDIQSIHERITKLEKKNDMFNLYSTMQLHSRQSTTAFLMNGAPSLPTSSCVSRSRVT